MADNEVKFIISADSSGAEAALHRLGQKTEMTLGDIKAKWLGYAAAIRSAIRVINQTANAFNEIAAKGAEFIKLSQQIGMSVEQIAALKYAAEMSDTSFESLTQGIGILSKTLHDASDNTSTTYRALQTLGIQTKGTNGQLKDSYQILVEVSEKFTGMKDGIGKTALAMELFGRGGKDLIPILSEGSAGIERLMARAKELGVVLTGEQAQVMKEYTNNIKNFKAHLEGLGIIIVNKVIPALNALFEVGSAKDKLSNIDSMIKTIDNMILKGTGDIKKNLALLDSLLEQQDNLMGADKDQKEKTTAPFLADPVKVAAAQVAAMQAQIIYLEESFKLLQSYGARSMAELDNQHQLGIVSDEDYYSQRKTAMWKDYFEQFAIADATKKLIKEEYAAKIAAALPVEKAALQAEEKTKLYALAVKENAAFNATMIKQKADATAAASQAHQRSIALIKLEYETTQALRQQDLEVQLNAYKVEEEQNNYLHEHLLMSNTEYYAAVRRLAEDAANKKKESAKAELDDAYKTMQDIYDNEKYTEDEKTKALEEYVKAVIKNNGDILKAAQELADKQIEINRKAAEDFAAGWEEGMAEYIKSTEWGYDKAKSLAKDAAESMTAAFQDFFFGKFKDGMAKIVDFFKRMLMQMIATAIANPIIMPIVQVINQIAGNPATATTAGTGLSGLMGTAIGSSTLGSVLGWGVAGYGIGSSIGGTAGGIGGSIGSMAGTLLTGTIIKALGVAADKVLAAVLGAVIPVVGALIGALIGSLIGGKDRPPAMDISYAPGQVPSHIGQGWEGASLQGASGRWEAVGQHGVDTTALAPIAKAFNDIGDATKDILSKLGLDISGFTKEWHKYIGDMSNMTAEQAQAAIAQAMAEYLSFATNIDFSKFSHSGEALIETVKRIMNALGQIAEVVSPSWDDTLKTGWDIAKMYDAIDIHANTYKEALNNIDTQITDNVTAMNAGTLTAEEWGDKLTEVGALLEDRYKLEIQYLTYIKQMQEQITNDVKAKITNLKLMGMDSSQRWDYLMTQGAQAYNDFMSEINAATPDASKIVGSYQELSQIFDALVAGIQQLGQAQASFQQTIDSIQTQYDTIGMTHQQKIDYYNKQIQEAYAAYLAATDPTTKAYYLGEVNKYAQAGWGEMTDAEKQKYGQVLLDWLKEVNEQAKADFQTLLTTAEQFWTAIGNYVQDALKSAVDAEVAALANLATQLNAIDWTPLQNLSDAASAAAASINSMSSAAASSNGDSSNSYASGSDYIPYTQKATIHQGESVLTAYGNKALAKMAQKLADMENNGATQPVTVVINASGGDMASFVNYTVKAATAQTIKVIRRNPAVLA